GGGEGGEVRGAEHAGDREPGEGGGGDDRGAGGVGAGVVQAPPARGHGGGDRVALGRDVVEHGVLPGAGGGADLVDRAHRGGRGAGAADPGCGADVRGRRGDGRDRGVRGDRRG